MKPVQFVEIEEFVAIVYSMTKPDFDGCYGVDFQFIPMNSPLSEDQIGWYRVGTDQWFESEVLLIGGWANPISMFNIDRDNPQYSLSDIREFVVKYFDMHIPEWKQGCQNGIIKIEFD